MKPKHPSLTEAIAVAYAHSDLAATSAKAYLGDWNRFAAAHPNATTASVTPAVLTRWMSALRAKGDGPATIRRRVASLKALFDVLIRLGVVIGANPTDGLKLPKLPHRVVRTVDRDGFNALLAAVEKQREGACPAIPLMLMLMGLAGLRRAEVAGLRIADVDLADGTLTIIGKGDKERVVPFAGRLAVELRKHIEGLGAEDRAAGWVFPSPLKRGEHIDPASISRIVQRAAKRAGVTLPNGGNVHAHTLRSHAVTEMLAVGGAVADVAQIAGHSNPATTMKHYAARNAEKQRVIAERMG